METLQPNQSAVVATFDTHLQAEQGVKELQKSGFDMKKLSIIGRGYHSEEHPLGFTPAAIASRPGAASVPSGAACGEYCSAPPSSGYPALARWQ